MSFVAKNFRTLRRLKGFTQDRLSGEIKISKARIGSYEETRSEPPIEVLQIYSDYFKISVDALIRYDLTKVDLNGLMKLGKNRLLFPIQMDENGNDLIEIVTVKASAGYTKGYADPEYIESLKHMNLPFLPTGKHRAFPIKGDSMPPMRDGSYVVGKYVESLSDIRDNRTYVLVTKDDGIVYKRVVNNIKKDKSLLLCSDNKIYKPYHVKAEDVFEAWEYTCSLNIGAYKEDELNMGSIMSMLRELKVDIEKKK